MTASGNQRPPSDNQSLTSQASSDARDTTPRFSEICEGYSVTRVASSLARSLFRARWLFSDQLKARNFAQINKQE